MNRAGGSPYPGGEFFAEVQRGVALCGARETAAPAAGAKRKGHLRFPFLFELLPFPCFLIRRRFPICDRFEKGNGRGFFLCYGRTTFGVRPLEQPVRSVRYRTATQVGYFQQARHSSAAQLVRLEFADSTYGLGVRCNLSSQVPCVTTCQGFARHCYAALCVE